MLRDAGDDAKIGGKIVKALWDGAILSVEELSKGIEMSPELVVTALTRLWDAQVIGRKHDGRTKLELSFKWYIAPDFKQGFEGEPSKEPVRTVAPPRPSGPTREYDGKGKRALILKTIESSQGPLSSVQIMKESGISPKSRSGIIYHLRALVAEGKIRAVTRTSSDGQPLKHGEHRKNTCYEIVSETDVQSPPQEAEIVGR